MWLAQPHPDFDWSGLGVCPLIIAVFVLAAVWDHRRNRR